MPALRRTATIVAAYLFVLFVHGLALASGEKREACAFGAPLADVVHQLQRAGNPWVTWFQRVNVEVVIAILAGALVAGLILHPARQLAFRRFLCFHGVIFSIRMVVIWVTTIPSPNPLCRGRLMTAGTTERAVTLTLDAVGIPRQWFGLHATGPTCCDIVLSGHAAMLVVEAAILLMLFESRVMRWLTLAVTTIGLLATIGPDRHYTVEVLLTLTLGALLVAWYRRVAESGDAGLVRWIEQPGAFAHALRPMSWHELRLRGDGR